MYTWCQETQQVTTGPSHCDKGLGSEMPGWPSSHTEERDLSGDDGSEECRANETDPVQPVCGGGEVPRAVAPCSCSRRALASSPPF